MAKATLLDSRFKDILDFSDNTTRIDSVSKLK